MILKKIPNRSAIFSANTKGFTSKKRESVGVSGYATCATSCLVEHEWYRFSTVYVQRIASTVYSDETDM